MIRITSAFRRNPMDQNQRNDSSSVPSNVRKMAKGAAAAAGAAFGPLGAAAAPLLLEFILGPEDEAREEDD